MSEIDHELEALIDRAGRDAVFSRARALGWSSPPPKWVWQGICADIIQRRGSGAERPHGPYQLSGSTAG